MIFCLVNTFFLVYCLERFGDGHRASPFIDTTVYMCVKLYYPKFYFNMPVLHDLTTSLSEPKDLLCLCNLCFPVHMCKIDFNGLFKLLIGCMHVCMYHTSSLQILLRQRS